MLLKKTIVDFDITNNINWMIDIGNVKSLNFNKRKKNNSEK